MRLETPGLLRRAPGREVGAGDEGIEFHQAVERMTGRMFAGSAHLAAFS